ncbi:MAG: GIY-YIG nuclease family protein [Sandaracinaceae bacterium]
MSSPDAELPARAPFWVYVLLSRDDARTYVGITTDVDRRLRQHNGELVGGAKSTRARRPWRVARRFGPYEGRGEASRAEAALKRLRGRARLAWSGLKS